MKNFYISIESTKGGVHFERVNGKTIRIPGASDFALFVRKLSKSEQNKGLGKFVITEERTGRVFSSGVTLKDAVRKVQEHIKRLGIQGVKDAINAWLMSQKITSPRYSEVSNPLMFRPNISKDTKRMRQLTMGCWWPSVAFPINSPRWSRIAEELEGLSEDDLWRGDKKGADEAMRLAQLARLAAKGVKNPLLLTLSGNPLKKGGREMELKPPPRKFRSAKEVFGGKKKIPIEKYEKWLKAHGTKQDITGFAKAKSVAVNAGNPVKTVSLIQINPGISGRTHLVRYGSSPEEWYHPPKGSAKAKHLKQVGAEVYKHKWRRRVPMFIDPQSGTIIKKLLPGQKADDWLRG